MKAKPAKNLDFPYFFYPANTNCFGTIALHISYLCINSKAVRREICNSRISHRLLSALMNMLVLLLVCVVVWIFSCNMLSLIATQGSGIAPFHDVHDNVTC